MKLNVYTIYDSKVKAYMQPFMAQTNGQALRMFADTVQDDKTVINKHPEDYTLFALGSYDDQTGKYENLETPQSLGVAIEYKGEQS